ncbi:MAG: thiamine phosphate synthase, partial [Candidatus Margulisbacteria bacterium]|nr:thiamine phosphate synthase [Candidatus Margulisiibacteriota bacterium]
EITRENNVKLIINDWPDVAKEVYADGVHVGQHDTPLERARKIMGPDKIIGGSAENLEDALRVESAGADYVGVGSVFPTSSKGDIDILGIKGLQEIKEKLKIPVVAIGGITSKNFTRVLDTGVKMVAVISDIFMAENITDKVKEYFERYAEYAHRIDY